MSPSSPHPRYWLEDGSIVIDIGNRLIKIHRSLLERCSPTFISLLTPSTLLDHRCPKAAQDLVEGNDGLSESPSPTKAGDTGTMNDCLVLVPDAQQSVSVEDFEALLGYLYHDIPPDHNAPFSHIIRVLRVSSPQKCNFPTPYAWALTRWEEMYSADPVKTDFSQWEHVQEALELSSELGLRNVEKGLLYAFVTNIDFDTGEEEGSAAPRQPVHDITTKSNALSTSAAQRCTRLLKSITSDFTATLFQPATAPHMACTDVLAEAWMPLVIEPAFACDGGYKPFETLRSIARVDWALHGLCAECVVTMRQGWEDEARDIWARMDQWIA